MFCISHGSQGQGLRKSGLEPPILHISGPANVCVVQKCPVKNTNASFLRLSCTRSGRIPESQSLPELSSCLTFLKWRILRLTMRDEIQPSSGDCPQNDTVLCSTSISRAVCAVARIRPQWRLTAFVDTSGEELTTRTQHVAWRTVWTR